MTTFDIRLTPAMMAEFEALEIETYEGDPGKASFIDALTNAQPRGRGYVVTFDEADREQLIRSLDNMIDVQEAHVDAGYAEMSTPAKRLLPRLRTLLDEVRAGAAPAAPADPAAEPPGPEDPGGLVSGPNDPVLARIRRQLARIDAMLAEPRRGDAR